MQLGTAETGILMLVSAAASAVITALWLRQGLRAAQSPAKMPEDLDRLKDTADVKRVTVICIFVFVAAGMFMTTAAGAQAYEAQIAKTLASLPLVSETIGYVQAEFELSRAESRSRQQR